MPEDAVPVATEGADGDRLFVCRLFRSILGTEANTSPQLAEPVCSSETVDNEQGLDCGLRLVNDLAKGRWMVGARALLKNPRTHICIHAHW